MSVMAEMTDRTSGAPMASDEMRAIYADQAEITFVQADDKQLSPLDVLLILVRERRLILVCTLIAASVGIIGALIPEESTYTATATVVRENSAGTTSRATSPLSMLGINFGGGMTGLTPSAYPAVLMSREVRLAVVSDSFYISRWDSTVQLVDYLLQPPSKWETFVGTAERYTIGLASTVSKAVEQERPSAGGVAQAPPRQDVSVLEPSRREKSAMAVVGSLVSTSVDDKTGLMTIAATTNDPLLSASLVESFIDHFQGRMRQVYTEKARQNLKFIQDRLARAETELEDVEEQLARFVDRNGSIQSARLMTAVERLQRKVDFKARMYSTLQAEYTQAEVDLQRSDPMITVLERPLLPAGPNKSSPMFGILLMTTLGLLLGVGVAMIRWYANADDGDTSKQKKLRELSETVKNSRLAHFLGALRPKSRQRSS